MCDCRDHLLWDLQALVVVIAPGHRLGPTGVPGWIQSRVGGVFVGSFRLVTGSIIRVLMLIRLNSG